MKSFIAAIVSLLALIALSTAQVNIASIDPINETLILENTNTNKSINMTNWMVQDGQNHKYIFPVFELPAKSQITLNSHNGNDTENLLYLNKGKRGIWNNDHDNATLTDNKGEIISTFNY